MLKNLEKLSKVIKQEREFAKYKFLYIEIKFFIVMFNINLQPKLRETDRTNCYKSFVCLCKEQHVVFRRCQFGRWPNISRLKTDIGDRACFSFDHLGGNVITIGRYILQSGRKFGNRNKLANGNSRSRSNRESLQRSSFSMNFKFMQVDGQKFVSTFRHEKRDKSDEIIDNLLNLNLN